MLVVCCVGKVLAGCRESMLRVKLLFFCTTVAVFKLYADGGSSIIVDGASS